MGQRHLPLPSDGGEGVSETILMKSSLKAVAEIELKFLVAPDDFDSLEANEIFAHEVAPVQLRSVYYDTPNSDLHKRGISLRVRSKGATFIQTVKRQSGQRLFDRDEWESTVKDEEPDPIAWVGTPVATILGKNGSKSLYPVFSTTVHRTTRLVNEGTGLVEVSIDRGDVAAGELREPIDEVELELKGGDPAALFGVARRLGASAVLSLSFQSKAERGYRLRGQNYLVAHKGVRADISGGMPVAEAFSLIARSCLAQVADNATLLSLAKSPEVLHQLRVGLRRLRAAFATFKPILLGKDMDRLKAEAKWLSGELDSARDLDVFLQNNIPSIESDAHDDPALVAFGARLLQAQTELYHRALGALHSKRAAAFLLDCTEWVEIRAWRRNHDPVAPKLRAVDLSILAIQALEDQRRQLRNNGKHLAKLDPAGKHRVRIKARRLYLAAEFFTKSLAGVAPKRRRKFMLSLKALQDRLGELNDITVARRTALAVVGSSTEAAFRAGRVVGGQDLNEPNLLAKVVEAYERWQHVTPYWR